jgi:hypothetical protein
MLFIKWIPTIIASHPTPQIIFVLLFAISIFRTIFFHSITALLRFLNIAFFRVLYP